MEEKLTIELCPRCGAKSWSKVLGSELSVLRCDKCGYLVKGIRKMDITEEISEALAIIETAVDNLDGALHKLYKVRLQDPEQLDKLNSLREQLNTLLVELEECYL